MSALLTRREAVCVLGAGLASRMALPAGSASSEAPLLLADAAIAPEVARRLLSAGAHAVHLIGRDLVRQWRDGLRAPVLNAPHVVALVRSDKALLLADLVREERRRVHTQALAGGLFRVGLNRGRVWAWDRPPAGPLRGAVEPRAPA